MPFNPSHTVTIIVITVLLFVSENTDGQWCRRHCVSAVHLLGHHKDKL